MSERIYLATVEEEAGTIPAERLPSSAVVGSTRIDLCRAPYNCVAGTDITKALQEAVEALVLLGGGTIYASKPGVYKLNGAMKEGTVEGYTYKGRVLFPARSFSEGRITVELDFGLAVPRQWNATPHEPPNSSGCVLLCEGSEPGWMFDAIPSEKFEATGPWTNLCILIKNCTFRQPNNPQGGCVNLEHVVEGGYQNVHGGINIAEPEASLPTGTLPAFTLPGFGNGSRCLARDVDIYGWSEGLAFAENAHLDRVNIQNCVTGLVCRGGGGAIHFNDVSAGPCKTHLKIIENNATIIGDLQLVPNTAGTFPIEYGIKDENNFLSGALQVKQAGFDAMGWPSVGLHGSGALPTTSPAVGIGNAYRGGVLCTNSYPLDTFTRVRNINGMGTADQTSHPWLTIEGKPETSSEGAKSGEAAATSAAVVQYTMRASAGTRALKTVIKTKAASTYNIQQVLNRTYKNNYYLYVKLSGGKVAIERQGASGTTLLAESAGSPIAENTEYTVLTLFEQPLVGAQKVKVYVNGTLAVEHELSTEDKETLAENAGETRKRDGLRWSSDTGSVCKEFQVIPSIA